MKNKKCFLKKEPIFFAPKKKCPYEYSRIGIQQSTQTAKLLREIDSQKQTLNQKETNFFNEMIELFSWIPEQSKSIIKLHEKIFNLGFLTQ